MSLITYDAAKHAALLTHYCLNTQPSERLLISSSTAALPLVQEINLAMLQAGARPVLHLTYPGQQEDLVQFGTDELLDQVHPADVEDMRAMDGTLRILTPADPIPCDPVKRARLMASRQALTEARAKKKWSLSLYPTPEAAAKAQMSEAEFEDFVMRAMFLDTEDPVRAWQKVNQHQAELIEQLSQAKQIRIEGPDTDISLQIGGRTWANSDGKRNMPSGEVFTGPLENSANGVITFDVPTVYAGQMVKGVRLEFKDGEVVFARAEEGQETLLAALETDEGAKRLGELGIGTNTGISRSTTNILFDEKISGTVHLALGRSYPETGGQNKSAIHWDLITDLRQGGRVSLDGVVWQENGKFV